MKKNVIVMGQPFFFRQYLSKNIPGRVNIQKATEHGDLYWIYPYKMGGSFQFAFS